MYETCIIVLPPERWREAKQLRLEALRREPTAFASSYEDELAFSDDVWQSRLAAAMERAGNMTYFAKHEGALVGMAGATWSPRAKVRHVATVYGVYVSPDMRGRGIASDLMHTLLDELQSMPQIEKVSLTVNSESAAATGDVPAIGIRDCWPGEARTEHRRALLRPSLYGAFGHAALICRPEAKLLLLRWSSR